MLFIPFVVCQMVYSIGLVMLLEQPEGSPENSLISGKKDEK
jgi:hypothetical protein